jgi:hypothetical protein
MPQGAGTEDDLQLPGHPTPLLISSWRPGSRACFKSHSHSVIAAMYTVAR